jgi:BASS family bile acid:Na+ symporter
MAGPFLIASFTFLALYFTSHPVLKKFAFTIWVFTFVSASLYYPATFGTWLGYDLKILIIPLIQIIMFGMGTTLRNGFILGFLLIGIVALAKLVIKFWLNGPENWMDKTLPVVSMAGICFIIAIITARSGEKLLTVGVALVAVTIIHNFLGYFLGYWLARLLRLREKDCRTVAFEVGMQNGGMASGLAMGVLNSAKIALAPAIFGPWMNISGSVLATWWHRKSDE